MEYTLNVLRNADHTLIQLSGELTVKNARKIAAQLNDVSERKVVIKLNHPEAMDLSFIQILAAWFHHLSNAGATIQMKASWKQGDMALLTKSGFASFFRTYNTNL